jgi:hypothetical protein
MKRILPVLVFIVMTLFLTGCVARTKSAFIMTQQLHIKYPVLDRLKDKAVQDRINKTIYSAVFRLRDENASALKKHQKEYSYYVKSDVAFDRKDILSIKFEECLSIPFYAHPFNAVYTVTVNAKDGSIYKLKDFFEPGVSWEADLNGILKKDIDELAKESEIPPIEVFKSINKEQEFYLSKEGLVLYWQEARYFPRYVGPLVITIKYSDLRGLLRKELKL